VRLAVQAVFHLKMTLPECLTALPLNPARGLGLGEEIGTPEAGKKADLVLLDTPNLGHTACHFGINPVKAVFRGGPEGAPGLSPTPGPAAVLLSVRAPQAESTPWGAP